MKYAFICLFIFTICGCVKSLDGNLKRSVNLAFHERSFGASNQELLKDDKFKSLNIEIQYVKGFKPDMTALNNLKDFLYLHLNKPEGIFMTAKEIDTTVKDVLNTKDVDLIERKFRSGYTNGDKIALYILYTNSKYVNNKILGEAYRNTSIVIYGKAVANNSGTINTRNRTDLETTILLHEMGHLLGLAKEGAISYTDHIDKGHKSHCQNSNCLMYYGIDIGKKFGPLIEKGVPKLDEECLFDLVANGGR